jgi:acetylornithine deacetylase/succinyl-diaminopimelate desuccinylase-like protein
VPILTMTPGHRSAEALPELALNTREDLVRLCQDLVSTRSVNGVDTEVAVADILATFAREHGLDVEVFECARDRPAVLVSVGSDLCPGLLLVAHSDTVSAGDEKLWSSKPFGGEIRQGKLFGRGAADNKGGAVAALAALLMIRARANVETAARLLFVPDEESGATGRLGISCLAAKGRLRGAGAIYTYSGMHRIVIGHWGVMRFKLVARGVAVHSGSASWRDRKRGSNAIATISHILTGLGAFEAAKAGVGGSRRFVVTPTRIAGGTDESVVPDRCEVVLDVRFAPELSGPQLEGELRAHVLAASSGGPRAAVTLSRTVYVPTTQTDVNCTVVTALRTAAGMILGRELAIAISGPANESYLLNELGIPTCVFGPQGGRAHSADEFVVVESLFTVARVYAMTAMVLGSAVV